jgi:hypothetical protein
MNFRKVVLDEFGEVLFDGSWEARERLKTGSPRSFSITFSSILTAIGDLQTLNGIGCKFNLETTQ